MAAESPDLARFGLAVGHATDAEGATGLTVVRGIDGPFRAAAAVFGRATGTRELHALDPHHLVDRVDAILLTGGSAFGLDAAAGVMRWMAERGRGYPVGAGVVPIVPAAVIFDLAPLGRADRMPTPEMAYRACEDAASRDVPEGSVGAGAGATVGKLGGRERAMKGGVGVAVVSSAEGGDIAALAVVNALGDVCDASGRIIAGARAADGSFLDVRRAAGGPPGGDGWLGKRTPAGSNTTLCVVASAAPMSRVELQQLAQAAGAALFRRIAPAGTSFDGDIVFAVAPAREHGRAPLGESLLAREMLAVEALELAIERGVRMAHGRDGIPGLADAGARA